MTDPTVPAAPPTSVAIASAAEMVFPLADPLTGQAYTAREQINTRIKNPTWARDAMTAGTPAWADLQRLNVQAATEEARRMGETFGLDPAAQMTEQLGAALDASKIRVPIEGMELTPELQKQVADLQAWVGAAGFGADDGTNLVTMAAKMDGTTFDSDEALGAAVEKSLDSLRGVMGANFQPGMDAADKLLAEIEQKRPGFTKYLEDRPHLLTNPLLVSQFIGMARRRYGV